MKAKTKTSLLGILLLFAVSVGIHTFSFLIINTGKVEADAAQRISEEEQKKRREVRAFINCLDIGIRNRVATTPSLTDAPTFATAWNDSGFVLGTHREVPIGNDLGYSNGIVRCDQLGSVESYLGFKTEELYTKSGSDWILINEKVDEVRNKAEDFVTERMPLTYSEMIRRIRWNLTNMCAVEGDKNPSAGGFEIDGRKFVYDDGGAAQRVPVGHDYDFDGGDDGQVSCGNIVNEALRLHIYSQDAANMLEYEDDCINEHPNEDLTEEALKACVAKKAEQFGPGKDTGSTNGSSDSKTGIDCDAVSWNPLKWFMCPLLHLAESAVRQLDNLITYMLTFPTSDYFDNSNNSLGNAWGSMRNLSLGLLVIAGLVMVISQAVSWGPFDAYTIKKVMPRLVFAVIFISISLPILRIMIEFSNVAGVGIRELIERLFDANFSNGVTFNNGALTIGTVAVGAAGLSLGFLGILSLMGTAILAVLIAFLVLTARQLLILMLVIVAPIAIACYILPNTERVWKMWWDFFWRALVAFPIISAFIATGHAFAKVASYSTTVPGSDSTLHDTLASLIAFAAYFGPYFALPFAFRLAGGAVGQIGGIVNDRSRGAFDRLKGFRKQQTAQNWQDTKAGNRFKGNNAVSRGASSFLMGATLVPKAGLRPSKWRRNMATARGSADFDLASKYMEESASFGAIKGDDDKLWALMTGTDEASIRSVLQRRAPQRFSDPRVLDEAVGEVMRAKRETSDSVARVAATRAQAATGTGFSDSGEMLEAINAASGGDRSVAGRMLAEMRGGAMGSGRVDLGGAGFATMATAMENLQTGRTPAGPAYDARAATVDVSRDVVNSQAAGTIAHASMKPAAVRALIPEMRDRLTQAASQGGAAYDRELARVANLYDTMAATSPNKADILADELLSLPPTALPPGIAGATLREVMESRRYGPNNQAYLDMRRELSAQQSTSGSVGGGAPPTPPAGGGPAAGPPGPSITPSDRRLKRNITRIDYIYNINLYSFQYLWSDQIYVGVIAQELLLTHPHAVYVNETGFYEVDYDILGIQMVTLEKWKENNLARHCKK